MTCESRLREGQLPRELFAKFFSTKEMEWNLKIRRRPKTRLWTSEFIKRIPPTENITAERMVIDGHVNYKCSRCTCTQGTRAAILGHINKVHRSLLLKCEKCEKYRTYNPDCLSKHVKTCGKNFYCKICSETFTCVSAVNRHLLIHEPPKYSCNKCDKKFTYKWHVKSHKCAK